MHVRPGRAQLLVRRRGVPRAKEVFRARSACCAIIVCVEDWVAIEVETDRGRSCFFMTWGRIQDALDPRPLEELSLRVLANGYSLGGRPVKARVCPSLRDAADQPFFYEALLDFAQKRIPRGDGFEGWRAAMAKAMQDGKEFHFLGRPPR